MDTQYLVPVKQNVGCDEPEHTLPRTGYIIEDLSARAKEQSERKRTFSVDPEQRTRFLPLLEGVAFYEPQGGALVASITCSVIIYRWIWGREPISKVLSNLVPCKND